jgi:hypothetical protein
MIAVLADNSQYGIARISSMLRINLSCPTPSFYSSRMLCFLMERIVSQKFVPVNILIYHECLESVAFWYGLMNKISILDLVIAANKGKIEVVNESGSSQTLMD